MKAIKKILPLFVVLTSSSCQTVSETQTASSPPDPIIAEAGWKIGQVYKTMKRGGLTQYGGDSFALETEGRNYRVKEAWRNSDYKSRWLAFKVPLGTLFQATEVEYSRVTGCYFVSGIQIPSNPVGTKIHIDLFGGEDMPFLNGVNGDIIKRDPNYLVPVEMPVKSQINH